MKAMDTMQLLTHYNIKQFSPSGLFCNAAEDGSKPVKMQMTEKTKCCFACFVTPDKSGGTTILFEHKHFEIV